MPIKSVTIQDVFFLTSAVELAAITVEEPRQELVNVASRHKACVVGAIVCSVSFLECSINGLYEDAAHHSRKTTFHKALSSVWGNKFEQLPILEKYQRWPSPGAIRSTKALSHIN